LFSPPKVCLSRDNNKKYLLSFALKRNKYKRQFVNTLFVVGAGSGVAGLFHFHELQDLCCFLSFPTPFPIHNFVRSHFVSFVWRCHVISTCSLRCSFNAHSRAIRFVARTSHVHAHTFIHTAEKMLLHKRVATFEPSAQTVGKNHFISAHRIVFTIILFAFVVCEILLAIQKNSFAFDRFFAYVLLFILRFFSFALFCHTFTQTWRTVKLPHTVAN